MKKVIVIGGSGFIGSVLIYDLIKNGYSVANIDVNLYGEIGSLDQIKSKKLININEDFINFKTIDSLVNQGFSKIIFLAGLVGDPISKKYPKLSRQVMFNNTKKFINFLEKKKHKISNFFFVSTCSNYGLDKTNKLLSEKSKLKPLSIYSKCKVNIEKFLFNKKLNFTILRFSTAFGMSKRMRFDLTINQFVKDVFLKKKLVIYDKDTYRPYLHTKDFSRLFLILLKTKKKISREIFNVGNNNNNFSKNDILNKILKKVKSKNIEFKRFDQDRRNYKVDFSKVQKKLNFRPKYSVEYGINEILNNLKKNKNLRKNLNVYKNQIIKWNTK